MDTGRRGDADVVFVHAKGQEEKFISEGAGVKRFPVMYNDFVLVGPKSDPAGMKGRKDIVAAMKTIRSKAAPFISRGDKSGTHVGRTQSLEAGRYRCCRSRQGRRGIKEIGQGMGAALNTASASNAYVLTDRGTWL